MNRKDRRAYKFGHWSPNRELYQFNFPEFNTAAEIDNSYWQNEDKDFSRYQLWEFTH